MKRRSKRRSLRIEQLDARNLFAVISVDAGPGRDHATALAEAIAAANATPEADRLELANGIYKLDALGEEALLEITSDISIVGVSPRDTIITSSEGFAAFKVTEAGALQLSELSLYASLSDGGGGIINRGVSTLNSVAIIGLPHDSSLTNPLSLQASGYTLVSNSGTLSVFDSANWVSR